MVVHSRRRDRSPESLTSNRKTGLNQNTFTFTPSVFSGIWSNHVSLLHLCIQVCTYRQFCKLVFNLFQSINPPFFKNFICCPAIFIISFRDHLYFSYCLPHTVWWFVFHTLDVRTVEPSIIVWKCISLWCHPTTKYNLILKSSEA